MILAATPWYTSTAVGLTTIDTFLLAERLAMGVENAAVVSVGALGMINGGLDEIPLAVEDETVSVALSDVPGTADEATGTLCVKPL